MICPKCDQNAVRRTNTQNYGSVRIAFAKCKNCGEKYKVFSALMPGDMGQTQTTELHKLLRGDVTLQLQIVSHVRDWKKSPGDDLVQLTLPFITPEKGGPP